MTTRCIRSFPLAYHISLHTYGSWLPGDPRGWHHRGDGPRALERPGWEPLRAVARELQRDPTVMFTEPMGVVVVEAVVTLAHDRGWRLYAAEAVSSHLHAVIGAPLIGVAVIREIREVGAKLLCDRGLHDPSQRVWSRGGHFSMVHTIAGLARAVEYVNRHRRPRGE